MPGPGLAGVIALVVAIGVIAVVLVIWARRTPAPSRRLHSMGREDSVSYFRDFSGKESAPGVREEDEKGRWGEGEAGPR